MHSEKESTGVIYETEFDESGYGYSGGVPIWRVVIGVVFLVFVVLLLKIWLSWTILKRRQTMGSLTAITTFLLMVVLASNVQAQVRPTDRGLHRQGTANDTTWTAVGFPVGEKDLSFENTNTNTDTLKFALSRSDTTGSATWLRVKAGYAQNRSRIASDTLFVKGSSAAVKFEVSGVRR